MNRLEKFFSTYQGKAVDFDGHYGDQCVDLFRLYVKEVLKQPQPKGVAGAKDFWTNYETDTNLNQYFHKIPNTPDGVSKAGYQTKTIPFDKVESSTGLALKRNLTVSLEKSVRYIFADSILINTNPSDSQSKFFVK